MKNNGARFYHIIICEIQFELYRERRDLIRKEDGRESMLLTVTNSCRVIMIDCHA